MRYLDLFELDNLARRVDDARIWAGLIGRVFPRVFVELMDSHGG